MARPTKEGLDYFPHDTDASHDERIEALEAMHGLVGYAVYFKLLEKVYKAGGRLLLPDFEMIEILSKGLGINPEKTEELIVFCCRFSLFDERIWEQQRTLTSSEIKSKARIVIGKRVRERWKYQAGETPFTRDRKIVFSRDGFACQICGENDFKKLTIDHIIPKSKGGADDIENLQTLCSLCNIRKSNKDGGLP